jgi:hypothetical protein
MATYKLIQDIEADDKLLGPLSFRQFIYAVVTVIMLYLSFIIIKHGAAILSVGTLPIAFLAGFLAFPFGKDQPTEVWAISKLRFYIKPRRRIWAQSGIKELVTVTVPKHVEIQRTDGLSEDEVRSRLQALANTIDSRGWAIKNVSGLMGSQFNLNDSDRLISVDALPQDVPDEVIPASEDLFDETANPIAMQVGQMLSADTAHRHQALIENLNAVKTAAASSPTQASVIGTPAPAQVTPIDPVSENELDQRLKVAQQISHSPLSNMHALRQKPEVPQKVSTDDKKDEKPESTMQNNPVIMNLAQRDDLNVNVLSNEVNRAMGNDGSDEVLISLH